MVLSDPLRFILSDRAKPEQAGLVFTSQFSTASTRSHACVGHQPMSTHVHQKGALELEQSLELQTLKGLLLVSHFSADLSVLHTIYPLS